MILIKYTRMSHGILPKNSVWIFCLRLSFNKYNGDKKNSIKNFSVSYFLFFFIIVRKTFSRSSSACCVSTRKAMNLLLRLAFENITGQTRYKR